jgi:hypothetical protein
MKLTKSYLRKLIKEELENSISPLADEEPSEELKIFVKGLVAGKPDIDLDAVHVIIGQTDFVENSGSKQIDKAFYLARGRNAEGSMFDDGIEPHGDE